MPGPKGKHAPNVGVWSALVARSSGVETGGICSVLKVAFPNIANACVNDPPPPLEAPKRRMPQDALKYLVQHETCSRISSGVPFFLVAALYACCAVDIGATLSVEAGTQATVECLPYNAPIHPPIHWFGTQRNRNCQLSGSAECPDKGVVWGQKIQ